MIWLFYTGCSEQFNIEYLQHYVTGLVRSGDAMICVGNSKFPSGPVGCHYKHIGKWGTQRARDVAEGARSEGVKLVGAGQKVRAVVFHDRNDDRLDEVAAVHQGDKALYGIVYTTGVFVAGPGCPQRLPAGIKFTGNPALYEGVFMLGSNGLPFGPWADWVFSRRPSILEEVGHGYQCGGASGSAPLIGRPSPDLWPANAFVFLLPDDTNELCAMACEDALASAWEWHLSRLCILGRLRYSGLIILDNRFTVLESPPE